MSRGCSHRRKRRVASNHLMGRNFAKKKNYGEIGLIEELLGLPFLEILQEAWNLNSKWKVHLALRKICKFCRSTVLHREVERKEPWFPMFPAKILFTLWNVKPTTQTRQLHGFLQEQCVFIMKFAHGSAMISQSYLPFGLPKLHA